MSIHQKSTAILNVCAYNKRDSKYKKQKLADVKREIDKPTVTAGNFDTPFSVNNKRQKISKDIEELKTPLTTWI